MQLVETEQVFFTFHNLNSKQSVGDTHSGRPKTSTAQDDMAAIKDVLDSDADSAADDPNIQIGKLL